MDGSENKGSSREAVSGMPMEGLGGVRGGGVPSTLTTQEKIDLLVKNISNMSWISFTMYFGKPEPKYMATDEILRQWVRSKLEFQSEGEYLLNIDQIYDDAVGNGEIIDL